MSDAVKNIVGASSWSCEVGNNRGTDIAALDTVEHSRRSERCMGGN